MLCEFIRKRNNRLSLRLLSHMYSVQETVTRCSSSGAFPLQAYWVEILSASRTPTLYAVLTSYSGKDPKIAAQGHTNGPLQHHLSPLIDCFSTLVLQWTRVPQGTSVCLCYKGLAYLLGTSNGGEDVEERCRQRGRNCYLQLRIISYSSYCTIGPDHITGKKP